MKATRIKNTIQHNGKRKVCRVYDAGPELADRYTVAFKGYRVAGWGMVYPYLAAGPSPYHPQGFGQHGESNEYLSGKHLGKRVSFDALPEQTQRFILSNI